MCPAALTPGATLALGLQGSSFAKTFVGTPQYWAPEVLNVQRGGGSYTQAADYWRPGKGVAGSATQVQAAAQAGEVVEWWLDIEVVATVAPMHRG
eukprot:Skav234240  [mRNA]  locus=scaffold1464:484372:484656:- [translate_table: standard]